MVGIHYMSWWLLKPGRSSHRWNSHICSQVKPSFLLPKVRHILKIKCYEVLSLHNTASSALSNVVELPNDIHSAYLQQLCGTGNVDNTVCLYTRAAAFIWSVFLIWISLGKSREEGWSHPYSQGSLNDKQWNYYPFLPVHRFLHILSFHNLFWTDQIWGQPQWCRHNPGSLPQEPRSQA